MNAMILAAGRGERLRPYTDTCPKSLLEVNDKALIVYHLEALAAAGILQVVINVSWLGEAIEAAIGDGSRFGLEVIYSREPEALEAAGGIVQALQYLDDYFIVVNADIYTDYAFENLLAIRADAHLVLVENPDFHPQGDFAIKSGYLSNDVNGRLTFAGIAQYRRAFFQGQAPGKQALAPMLRQAADKKVLKGEIYTGKWTDVGTLARWQSVSQGVKP